MSEKKMVLIADEHSRNSYWYHHIKKLQQYIPGLCILHIYLTKWTDFRIGMNNTHTISELHMPLMNTGGISEEKKIKMGHRILDFLILQQVIRPEEPVIFLLNNSSLYFLMNAIRNRLAAKIIVYVDALEWENRPQNEYTRNLRLFRTKGQEDKLRTLRNKEERHLFEMADAVWCHTEEYRMFVSSVYGIPDSKTILYRYAPFSQGKDPALSVRIRKNLSIFPDEKIIFFYYSSFDDHTFKILFNAIRSLSKGLPAVRLIITGRHLPAGLQDSMDLTLLCKTVFLGDRTIEELLPFIQASDLVITLSSRQLKNTLFLDTLLTGIPMISSPNALPDEYTSQVRLLSQSYVAGELAACIREILDIKDILEEQADPLYLLSPVVSKNEFLQHLALI